MKLLIGLCLAVIALGVGLLGAGWLAREATTELAGQAFEQPTSSEADLFHPARQPAADGTRPAAPKPAYGGRVNVHMQSMPKSLCYPIDNSAVVRRVLHEVHETLMLDDWETLEPRGDLARAWYVEDTLFLTDDDPKGRRSFVYGAVFDEGESWRVEPRSPHNPLTAPRRLAKSAVLRREPGTAITFELHSHVRWHDGEPFDARDVLFSWRIYQNPELDCDEQRWQFTKIFQADAPNAHSVRFFFESTYYRSLFNLGDMCILPAHLYDLTHPDHGRFDLEYASERPARDPAWKPSDAEQADYIEQHPNNRKWVGLGPYRVVRWESDYIEAQRFEGYFDSSRTGYLDTLRWRAIPNDTVAFQALLNGELDFFDRLSADDYWGPATESPTFTERFYKGWCFSGTYGLILWNSRRPQFADARVRRGLAHVFPFDEFGRDFYRGLAVQVTGPQNYFTPANDRTLAPYPHDLSRAAELFAEAGWYDRDGDGVLEDGQGRRFEFEFISPAGNKSGKAIALRFQEELAKVGVRLALAELEWVTFQSKLLDRDFDAATQGWVPPNEVDPEQQFHSQSGARGSNSSSLADPEVDRLIEAAQRELDEVARRELWHALQRRLQELQPVLYLFNPARKFALNRSLWGFQTVRADPNYVLRRWYYPAGTPGTRAALR